MAPPTATDKANTYFNTVKGKFPDFLSEPASFNHITTQVDWYNESVNNYDTPEDVFEFYTQMRLNIDDWTNGTNNGGQNAGLVSNTPPTSKDTIYWFTNYMINAVIDVGPTRVYKLGLIEIEVVGIVYDLAGVPSIVDNNTNPYTNLLMVYPTEFTFDDRLLLDTYLATANPTAPPGNTYIYNGDNLTYVPQDVTNVDLGTGQPRDPTQEADDLFDSIDPVDSTTDPALLTFYEALLNAYNITYDDLFTDEFFIQLKTRLDDWGISNTIPTDLDTIYHLLDFFVTSQDSNPQDLTKVTEICVYTDSDIIECVGNDPYDELLIIYKEDYTPADKIAIESFVNGLVPIVPTTIYNEFNNDFSTQSSDIFEIPLYPQTSATQYFNSLDDLDFLTDMTHIDSIPLIKTLMDHYNNIDTAYANLFFEQLAIEMATLSLPPLDIETIMKFINYVTTAHLENPVLIVKPVRTCSMVYVTGVPEIQCDLVDPYTTLLMTYPALYTPDEKILVEAFVHAISPVVPVNSYSLVDLDYTTEQSDVFLIGPPVDSPEDAADIYFDSIEGLMLSPLTNIAATEAVHEIVDLYSLSNTQYVLDYFTQIHVRLDEWEAMFGENNIRENLHGILDYITHFEIENPDAVPKPVNVWSIIIDGEDVTLFDSMSFISETIFIIYPSNYTPEMKTLIMNKLDIYEFVSLYAIYNEMSEDCPFFAKEDLRLVGDNVPCVEVVSTGAKFAAGLGIFLLFVAIVGIAVKPVFKPKPSTDPLEAPSYTQMK